MTRTTEIRTALADLQAFARQMGFEEAVAGLTLALSRVPADPEKADQCGEATRRDS